MRDLASGSSITVAATTVTQVLAKRQGNRRVAFQIANVGSNPVFIVPSDTSVAAANTGIYLAAGGVTVDSDATSYQCWSGGITAYSTAGTTLAVWERTVQ